MCVCVCLNVSAWVRRHCVDSTVCECARKRVVIIDHVDGARANDSNANGGRTT